MASNVANVNVNIGANTAGFNAGINQVSQQTTQLSQTMGKIGMAIGAAFAADKIIGFAKEASELAQVAEGVEAAFKRIGGDQIMGSLQKATKGTVSDLELMKAAVQASNFKIPLDQLGSLLAFAHQRAKDTGQSVDYLVNSIVMGIGRKSPLILDNLGISAVALKEKMKGIGTETATVGDVAKAVGEIASEAMKEVGESAETTAEKTARLSAEWANVKVEVGKLVNIVVSKAAPVILNFLKNTISGFKGLTAAIIEAYREVNQGAVNNGVAYVDDLSERLQKAGKSKLEADKRALELYKENIFASIKVYEEVKKNGTTSEQKNAKYQIGVLELELKGVTDVLSKRQSITALGEEDLKNTKEKVEAESNWLKEWGEKDYSAEERVYSEDTDLQSMSGKYAKASGGSTKSGIDNMDELLSKSENIKGVAQNVVDATQMMRDGITNFIDEFATGIGELITGAASFDDFGKMILKSVGGFMTALGKQLIALGVAKVVADVALSIPGGGVGLIAAGAALVALGGAVSSSMSGSPMSGARGVSSGSYSGMSSNKDMKLQIEGVVKGTDIYWSQKRLGKQMDNTTVKSR